MFFRALKYFFFAVFVTLFTLCPPLQAKEDVSQEKPISLWNRHVSLSGIFKTKFPRDYKYNIFPFRFNNRKTAFSVEIVADTPDNHEAHNGNLMIHASQTFGGEISLRMAQHILDREARRYVRMAKKINGTILTNKDIQHAGFLGKDIYIIYEENGVKQGFRARLYMTNYALIEQLLADSAHRLYSYQFDDFFNSFKPFDGITTLDEPEEFGNGWVDYPSKNNIFSIKLPPQNSDYTPDLPVFEASPTKESMQFKFVDPVLKHNLYYNVYTYKSDHDISYVLAKQLLYTNHVKKYVENATINDLKTSHTFNDNNGSIEMNARLIITPPEGRPYLTNLLLNVRYKDDTLLIQEILTSANHAQSGLPLLLRNSLVFHPERYKAVGSKE